jgi:hypothetical protein
MNKRAVVIVALLALTGTPASAQIAVIDPLNLIQAILIVQRTERHYEELVSQSRTILRMAEGLGRMDSYRTPALALAAHDVDRWTYGRPWIAALNDGDATGAAYLSTALPLERPNLPSRLTDAARKAFERQYATVEITDSVAMMGGHQVGLMRGYHGALERVAQLFEGDVLSSASPYHQMTAILDKVAAGELLGRRQDMATNQLLSHALEQLLARSKRQRDTEASTLNMQLVTWRDGDDANRAFRTGMGEALSTWRQP